MMNLLSRLWHWLLQSIRNLDSGSEWAAYTITGMVGLWGVLLVFPIFVDDPPYLEVVDRGQLFLYSVGFLMSSLYLVQRDWTTTFLPHRSGLRTACIFVLILSMIMFASVTLASTTNDLNPPEGVMAIIGVIALAISLVIGYMIARAEAARESFDIDAEREKQKLLAEADFNEALGAQGETQ